MSASRMDKEPWYSVKCIFAHDDLSRAPDATVYEERIVMLRACSLDNAMARGEAEAQEYAAQTDARYTGFISAFHLFGSELTDNVEVYSLMRESTLSTSAYLDHYHDDGTEFTQKM